jgi:hypothetical protein
MTVKSLLITLAPALLVGVVLLYLVLRRPPAHPTTHERFFGDPDDETRLTEQRDDTRR